MTTLRPNSRAAATARKRRAAGGDDVLHHHHPVPGVHIPHQHPAGAVLLGPLAHRKGVDGLALQIAGQRGGVGDGVRPHGEAADGIHLQVPDQVKENLPDEGQPLGIVGGGAAIDIVRTLPARSPA